MVRILFRILSLGALLVVAACSQTPEEAATSAIDQALYHLSQPTPECQKAIDVLEDIDDQDKNPRYLQALASAYACRGGFSELTLFDEVDTIESDFDEFLGSLAALSTSEQTEAESDEFADLQRAIDILLYAGGKTTPSAAQQKAVFGARQGGNLNLQALYMILVQLGRYARWYGDTNDTGNKGSGSAANTCFFDYGAGALAVATGHGGGNACVAGNSGHVDLDYAGVGTAVAQRRLCQGAMLINNMVDILDNTTLSSNDSIGEIANLSAMIDPYLATASALDPDMDDFIATLSQEDCEDLVAADDDVAELYFASLFEGGLP